MTTSGSMVHSISHRVVLAMVGVALMAGVPLAALPAAAETTVASTTRVVASYEADIGLVSGFAEVVTEGADHPTGVVVFSEGGQEVARGTLVPGAPGEASVSFYLELNPGQHVIEGSYLGDAATTGSSATATVTVDPAPPRTYPITAGTIQVGDAEAPMGTTGSFADGPPYLVYDSRTGGIRAGISMGLVEFTKQVTGVGAVTVVVQPDVSLVDPWLSSDGQLQARRTGAIFRVRWVEINGVAWAAACPMRTPTMAATGSLVPDGLVFTLETPGALTVPGPSDCGGRGALIGEVLSGPIRMSFEVSGDFSPLPPAPNTPTTTVLELSDTDLEVGGDATATIRVENAGGYEVRGTVVLEEDGVRRGSALLPPGDVVTISFSPSQVGSHLISAHFLGETHPFDPSVALFAPSADAVAINVGPAGAGWEVAGEFAIGETSAALPAGTRLADADLDVVAGRLQGSLIIPPGSINSVVMVEMKGQLFPFPITIRYQIIPEADLVISGVGDQVVVEPLPVRLVILSYDSGPTGPVDHPCTFGPFDLALTGSVDATGLHLTSGPVVVPWSTDGSCYVAQQLVAPGITLNLDIAGPAPAPVATTTQVVTWFPAVAQFDNTYLVAAVRGPLGGATPIGSVVFRDGERTLGTVPLDLGGRARLVATMTSAGARTVTADFVPADGFTPSTATTEVDVVGLTGRTLSGTITMGGTSLAVGPGSVLQPSVDPGGARVMFAPDTIDLVVDGSPVQADVRLIQIFDVDATVAPDGTVTDFDGGFLLHVRSVTTASGTVFPTWCVSGVVFRTVDGVRTVTASPAPMPQCTGIGEAVAARLVGEGVADLVASPG